MRINNKNKKTFVLIMVFGLSFLLNCQKLNSNSDKSQTLLNVSYDPTREFYHKINPLFTQYYKNKTGIEVAIYQSHGGSGKQARSVIDGIDADVVTLALGYDIDAISTMSQGKLLSSQWQSRLANNSSPYTSTIVFLVRKGNPKSIKDWDDLIKEGVEVITPNPKISGGARWNYLAAWGYALKKFNNDEEKAKDFVKKLYQNVKVLDTGARASTNTFVQRELGDVLITWENEAFLALREVPENVERINPSISILAEPPVAMIDQVVEKRKTKEVAVAYLQFLYSKEAQRIIAKNYFRPRDTEILKEFEMQFPNIKLFTIDEVFGGWGKVQEIHFKEGGIFDTLYQQ